MGNTIHITGQMPENWELALQELKDDLGFAVAETGIPVYAVKGEAPAVVCDGKSVTVTWAEPIHFYRCLSLIPMPLEACDIHEKVGLAQA